jgi:hypothetical protein
MGDFYSPSTRRKTRPPEKTTQNGKDITNNRVGYMFSDPLQSGRHADLGEVAQKRQHITND